GDDELGLLTDAFNQMLARIHEQNEDLQQNEARARAVLDNAVDAIISIDENGIMERFNTSAEKLFGYRADEAVGQNVNMLMPSPYHGEHDAYLSNYRETGEKKVIGIGREVVGKRKDGTTFPAELSVGEVRFGQERRFTGFLRDITERKSAEEVLREN